MKIIESIISKEGYSTDRVKPILSSIESPYSANNSLTNETISACTSKKDPDPHFIILFPKDDI